MKAYEVIAQLQRHCDDLTETLADVLAVVGDYQPGSYGSEGDAIIEKAEEELRARRSPKVCGRCGYGRARHEKTRDLGHDFEEQA